MDLGLDLAESEKILHQNLENSDFCWTLLIIADWWALRIPLSQRALAM